MGLFFGWAGLIFRGEGLLSPDVGVVLAAGVTGVMGVAGVTGVVGVAGVTGIVSAVGVTGVVDAAGVTGVVGVVGVAGLVSPREVGLVPVGVEELPSSGERGLTRWRPL